MTLRSSGTATVLRWGVMVSCGLFIAGLFAPPAVQPQHLVLMRIGEDLAANPLLAATHAGIIALILTPLLRVVTMLIDFLRCGDRSFALISLGVLLLLAVSTFVGFGGSL